MVLWCRACGTLMGVHEPYCDRHADRNGLCARCAEQEMLLILDDSEPKKKSTSNTAVSDAMLTAHFSGPHIQPENVAAPKGDI